MKPLLSIEGLTVELSTRDRTFDAVSDLTFAVSRNVVLARVGESGSGKSMTAMAIMRLLPEPVAGIVGGRIDFRHLHADCAPAALRLHAAQSGQNDPLHRLIAHGIGEYGRRRVSAHAASIGAFVAI